MEKRLKNYIEYYRQMATLISGITSNATVKFRDRTVIKDDEPDKTDSETLERIDKVLPGGREEFLREMLIQIGFFQHERFIHLVVTVLFAILAVFSVIAFVAIMQVSIIILAGMFFVLLIPYIRHYFILENGVQELYEYYDIIAHAK